MADPNDQLYRTADTLLATQPQNRGEDVIATLSRALVDARGRSILEVQPDGSIILKQSGVTMVDPGGNFVGVPPGMDTLATRTVESTPNAITAPLTPAQLTMRPVSRQRSVDPWPDDRFLICQDDFMDHNVNGLPDAGHKVLTLSGTAGTTTLGGSAYTLSATAGAWNVAVQPRCRIKAPYIYIQTRVSAAQGCGGTVGICKDGNNAAGVTVDPTTRLATVFAVVNGTSAALAAVSAFQLLPGGYDLMAVVCYPEVWAYVNLGQGWIPCGYVTFPAGADLRVEATLQQWQPYFGANMGATGASISFGELQIGYVGGIGTRDYKPITYKDGTPYRENGKIWVSATCATGFSFYTNHMAVMSIDPVTYHARLESHLFYRLCSTDLTNPAATRDLTTACYGGQIVYDEANDQFELLVNSWGLNNGDDNGIRLVRATSGEDILHGVHLLDGYEVVMPLLAGQTVSHYDDSFYFDAASGLWHMACIESANDYPISNRAPALFTSPDLATWTRVTDRHALDGLTLDGVVAAKVGNQRYFFAGGSSDYYFFNAADLSDPAGGNTLPSWKNFDGTPVFQGFPPHACPIPLAEGGSTRYLALTYDSSYIYPITGGFGRGTVGALVVLEADQRVTGNEHPLRRALRHGR